MGAKEPPRLEGCIQRGGEIQPDVFEVSGTVKWFDPSKGYGFITPDEDLPDVLLHVTCLRRAGFQTAYEGARADLRSHEEFRRVCRPSASVASTIRRRSIHRSCRSVPMSSSFQRATGKERW